MPLPDGVFRVVKPSGKVYWYHQQDRGKPTRGPLTRLPEPNTPEWHKAMAALTGDSGARPGSVSSVIDAMKAGAKWGKLSASSRKLYQLALGQIIAAWGDLPASGVKPRNVAALLERFADRPALGNQVLLQVRAIMKIAVQQGLRLDNPAREIDMLPETPDTAKPLTPEAWAALTSPAAPEALRRLAILGRATGQRIGDLLAMRPADRDGAGINCSITKLGGRPHWCILTPAEAKVIDGWKQFKAAPYVMKPGGRRYSMDAMRHVWRKFAATPEGAALAGFSPHDLRATKVCDERLKRVEHHVIAARVGMSLGMVMHYTRHIDQRLVASAGTETEPVLKTASKPVKTAKPK